MFSLFIRLLGQHKASENGKPDRQKSSKARSKQPSNRPPALPPLEDTFYPWTWQGHAFDSPLSLLKQGLSHPQHLGHGLPCAKDMAQALLSHPTYQDWINFTVFGRYVQRSFVAFSRQSEDAFNADMPELLRHELHRHAQRLPIGQHLFLAGKLPVAVRQEKLLTASVNVMQVLASCHASDGTSSPLLNVLHIASDSVLGFAIKHNKHTRDKTRCEVMILDFSQLRLRHETWCDQRQIKVRFYDVS